MAVIGFGEDHPAYQVKVLDAREACAGAGNPFVLRRSGGCTTGAADPFSRSMAARWRQ